MKDISKEEIEAGRPKTEVKQAISFCLENLYRDREKASTDIVAGNCSYEELLDTLLLAGDACEELAEIKAEQDESEVGEEVIDMNTDPAFAHYRNMKRTRELMFYDPYTGRSRDVRHWARWDGISMEEYLTRHPDLIPWDNTAGVMHRAREEGISMEEYMVRHPGEIPWPDTEQEEAPGPKPERTDTEKLLCILQQYDVSIRKDANGIHIVNLDTCSEVHGRQLCDLVWKSDEVMGVIDRQPNGMITAGNILGGA